MCGVDEVCGESVTHPVAAAAVRGAALCWARCASERGAPLWPRRWRRTHSRTPCSPQCSDCGRRDHGLESTRSSAAIASARPTWRREMKPKVTPRRRRGDEKSTRTTLISEREAAKTLCGGLIENLRRYRLQNFDDKRKPYYPQQVWSQ